jgi:hypothetical protein
MPVCQHFRHFGTLERESPSKLTGSIGRPGLVKVRFKYFKGSRSSAGGCLTRRKYASLRSFLEGVNTFRRRMRPLKCDPYKRRPMMSDGETTGGGIFLFLSPLAAVVAGIERENGMARSTPYICTYLVVVQNNSVVKLAGF